MEANSRALPSHGWINCNKCLPSDSRELELGAWKIVNDPGAWGSTHPRVLVLGFSKGFTQAKASSGGRFEDVPFKGMRPRLSETLVALGILAPGEDVSRRMVGAEGELAFGSLVRCSLSRFNDKAKRFECTGAIMPKAFSEEASSVVGKCAETFLSKLPQSLRLVVMLGTGDAYIDGCRGLIKTLHPHSFSSVNDIAYTAGNVFWVHASHPSGLNGHHSAWIAGDLANKQGRKFQLAKAAVRLALSPDAN